MMINLSNEMIDTLTETCTEALLNHTKEAALNHRRSVTAINDKLRTRWRTKWHTSQEQIERVQEAQAMLRELRNSENRPENS